MTRLWSRFGVRALAVGILVVGVGGGYYLGHDRRVQEQGIDARFAAEAQQAENVVLKEHHLDHESMMAQRRDAEAIAAQRARAAAKAAAERAKRAEEASRKKREQKAEEPPPAKPYTGPIPASCNEYSGNRKVGCALMLADGFKIDQFPCLDKLWSRESGWNEKALNEGSGAYGIPQAKPGNKMATAGDDWQTSAATQIKWGLGYIEGRYDDPCGAWAHSEAEGWY